MKKEIILPADIYDTIELSALAFGGIGAGDCELNHEPHCALGHLGVTYLDEKQFPIIIEMAKYGITWQANDTAIINIRRNSEKYENVFYDYTRVTFEEWCTELNVVRGE